MAIPGLDWLTPPYIIKVLGPFDLDPCASVDQPWRTADTQWTIEDNGLGQAWNGFVWLNPPYGPEAGNWLWYMGKEHNHGIALIFARTETKMFTDSIWPEASAILFIEGRLHLYHGHDGVDKQGRPYKRGERARHNAGGPSVLVAYGADGQRRLASANRAGKIPGWMVFLKD